MVLFEELKALEDKKVVVLTKYCSVHSGIIDFVRPPTEEELKRHNYEISGYGQFGNIGFCDGGSEPIFVVEDLSKDMVIPFQFLPSDIVIPLEEFTKDNRTEEERKRQQEVDNMYRLKYGNKPVEFEIRERQSNGMIFEKDF